ncbi:type II toxin-antitoxin system YafQ family toxin [Pelistega ratti]|uniref:type II toxin-antitoxin system RelE/ParE family toxin n=1 Tax=Pelistega ratti TaxID=2652177 RepID=UPI0013572060|nr:type II toxin-antitoxin system YafQ family toxin [Pelistega ratti]
MRDVIFTSRFKKDFKREKSSVYKLFLESDEFMDILTLLRTDTPLAEKYCDHAMKGQFKGLRNCHLRPDLVLLYELPDKNTLILVRMGSHSQLGI